MVDDEEDAHEACESPRVDPVERWRSARGCMATAGRGATVRSRAETDTGASTMNEGSFGAQSILVSPSRPTCTNANTRWTSRRDAMSERDAASMRSR